MSASDGGGIYTDGQSDPQLVNVTFNANTATNNGGGMANANANISLRGVTLNGNTAGNHGGAIYDSYAYATLTDVTLAGNSALAGGAIYNDIFVSLPSTINLTNVTFKANTASTAGGGMFNVDPAASLSLNDVILWGDSAPQGAEVWNASAVPVIKDSVIAGGCPLTSTCTHVIGANPLLGPLAANGGYTQTIAPGMGSSAIDSGGANAACASTDQRGISRPQGLTCDIGAYEVRNLALNPGFNSYAGSAKIPAKWAAVHFAAADGKDTTVRKEGGASVKISGAAATTKTIGQTIATSGPAGTKFTFTFWARGASIPAAGLCQAQVLFYSGTSLNSTKTVPCAIGSYATFQKKTIIFSTSTSFTKAVIRFTYSKASGTVWFDAVSLMR